MTETDIAWFAGIVDGEGTIGAYRTAYSRGTIGHNFLIDVSNTNERIIIRCIEIMRAIGEAEPILHNSIKKGSLTVVWGVRFKRKAAVLKVLNAIQPYLVGKRDQCDLLIELLSNRRHRRRWTKRENAIIDELAQMKKVTRGNPQLSGRGRKGASASSTTMQPHPNDAAQERPTSVVQLRLVG